MRPISLLFPGTYLAVGAVQAAAVAGGMQTEFSWTAIPAGLVGTISGFTPVIGTVAGIWGATTAWEWSRLAAAALFIGPLCAAFLAVFVTWMVTKKTNPY